MGESMITSFDGTKLYLKKETAADNKAVIVIVHGLLPSEIDSFTPHAISFQTWGSPFTFSSKPFIHRG